MTARIAIASAVLLAALAAAPVAHAELDPPRLVSLSPLEQADAVASPALSADGHYVVFAGSLGGIRGVLRKDLQSGAVATVAGGDAYGTDAVTNAGNPSISADGRYVSFTTSAPLDPAHDTNTAPDVYVRDMACDPASGCPLYTLASARDGSADGLSYTTGDGSVSAPRAALSADGRRVAFVIRSPSDLTSGSDGSTPGTTTPGGQVVVRDLDTQRTTLVSGTRDATTGAMTGTPVDGGAVEATSEGMGATLSADGTTVAWLGDHIGAQVPTLRDEDVRGVIGYDEPLWRRIADGPSAPTRRMIGGGDPLAPGCSTASSVDDPTCQGPFPTLHLGSDLVEGWIARPEMVAGRPALSADGRVAALVGAPGGTPDLFVVDMRDGLTRRQAVRQLTAAAFAPPNDPAFRNWVYNAGISPDGTRVAFSTARQQFLLAPPFLEGSTPAQQGLTELYAIDLTTQIMRRMTNTVDGTASGPGTADGGGGAGSPTFSSDDSMLVFGSSASNLVPVDANNSYDAFLVTEHSVPAGQPGSVLISAPPKAPAVPIAWKMSLRAVAQRDGTVRLDAVCPGGGVLRATVQATVPVTTTVTIPARRGHKKRKVKRRVLVKRRVALASTVVRGPGPVRLVLRTSKAYKSLVTAKAGLDASAHVTFSAPARKALVDDLDVRFRIVPPKKKTSTKKPASRTTKKQPATKTTRKATR
ncbi:MAG TPA: hypothetical protein VI318_08545 [Baekduia sp.]